ncbi:uncharacterized protein F5891DRAFT_719103 [Suillus fuscotomentosus]|uniref:F-box domain-containing protein n=1 Tax=Suillus fuscotomentosus TaxID=1912939 RepID=A0AAD4EES5_9AGAM|nr:uncharacterized protein F5891DRAFT_719103 [Suillus fuscotomentosus]KAG1904914.1 hypothetical protein F5891DRAFT_719103 [Suillus fuscotomentosus]
MHNALKVNEIVYTILEHVKSSKSDLRNMAMTCSAFSNIALDMLWSQQDSLTPLFRCLPRDTWNPWWSDVMDFIREPLPTEWERVRINAVRIRELVFTGNTSRSPKPSLQVVQRLFELFPPAVLFPKLRTLHFKALSQYLRGFDSELSLLRQFLSPRLERLVYKIEPRAPAREVEQLFDDIFTQAPGLQQLSLLSAHKLLACPSKAPKLPKKLNVLSIGPLRIGLMKQIIPDIQHLRSLQSLTLAVGKSFDMTSDGIPLEFSTLKHLHLTGARLEHCTSFLHNVTMPQLSSLEIWYFTASGPAEVTAVVRSLSTFCKTFAFLENITMINQSGDRFGELGTLRSNIFRPLLLFGKLSSVKFIDIGKYCLDDAFIEDAAFAWPDLHTLTFASKEYGECQVTLTSVLSLATRCKSLHELHLTFDATHFPTLPRAPDGNLELWTTQTAFRKLNIGESKVSEASRLHLFLAVLFPNLARLEYYIRFEGAAAWIQTEEAWRELLIERENSPDEAASWPNFLLQLQP